MFTINFQMLLRFKLSNSANQPVRYMFYLTGFLSGVRMIQFLRKETLQMGRIDLRKFDDVRHLVRARLLSSEFHDLEKIVKEHVAADVWKTYYLSLPAPDGFAPWDITYSLLEEWPGVTIDDLSVAAEENEVGTQTMMKMFEVLQAYLDTPPWDGSPAMFGEISGDFWGTPDC